MSIIYCLDSTNNPLRNNPQPTQEAVIFNGRTYDVLTYQLPWKWGYAFKNIYKIFRALVTLQYRAIGTNKLKDYLSKAFFNQNHIKQVVIPQSSTSETKPLPNAVDTHSRLGRFLYWKDILKCAEDHVPTSSYFLSKHFSKLPSESNFDVIYLMPVYKTTSTVPFLPSGTFNSEIETLFSRAEGKVLTLFYNPLNNNFVRKLLQERRLMRSTLNTTPKYFEKGFKYFGLPGDKALPFPQELIDMLISKRDETN